MPQGPKKTSEQIIREKRARRRKERQERQVAADIIDNKHLLERIVWDDADGYSTVKESIESQSRWMTHIETIFKRESDGKLFGCNWARPSTENSGENEYPDIAHEVEAVEVKIIEYRKK